MYDELVKRLRTATTLPVMNALCQEAADAIEELTGFVQEAERDRDEYRERLDKANDAIEELQQPKWIPVTDRLPEDGTLLGKLICDSEGHIRIATQFARIGLKDKWVYTDLIDIVKFLEEDTSEPISEWEDITHITHWMPLPEPPKEET